MSIVEYYTDQNVFITGGSGFIGKVTIEKILRSLPNIGKIYVLIRTKKGKTPDERLQEILNSSLFRRARAEQPQAFQKVVAIDGDCQALGLGISSIDMEKIRHVTMIFHVAACVRFDEDLKTSILLNTRGTHELVKIAESLPNLKAFIHVSTTFAHPDVEVLLEKMYPPYADWRTTIKLAETFDGETLNVLFPKYSLDHPNTYTFTKSLAEHIIDDYRHKLPVAILRPSIVISTVDEPFPGYIDNFNGPMGMLVACGVGIMRTNYSNPDVVSDVIPVDICAKTLLVAAYKVASEIPGPARGLDIFNCSKSSNGPCLSNAEVIDLGKKVISENPLEKCIWHPDGGITRCAVWHYIRLVTQQIIPAILLDCLIRLAKQPPVLLKLQRRIHATSKILSVFLNTQWTFINDNCSALENRIPDKERDLFGCLIYADSDQEVFMANGLRGAKEFLLKESPEASPHVRLRMHIFRVLHYLFQFIGTFYIVRILFRSLHTYINSV